MKRAIAIAVGILAGAMWLATPAHATPVPSPSPTPTVSTPADPCAFPTPNPTLEEVPQASGPAVLDMRKRPKLPLPADCFVEFIDTCDGTLVTLKNPIPRIAIKYRVNGEDGTHTVGFGETEQVVVPSSESPFGIWIVISDEEDGPKFPVTRHKWVEPKDCATPSPTPSAVPTPVETPDEDEPQLPVTGQNLASEMWLAGGLTAALLAVGAGWLVACRRRATPTT